MYKNIFSCNNKVALIIGGNGLLGKEVVKGLYDFGAKVYSADIDNTTSDDCSKDKLLFEYCDITNETSIRSLVEKVVSHDHKIDIFINCAYPRTSDWGIKLEAISFDSWKSNVDMHLGGYFLCCKVIAEQMKKQSSGSIINFSSIYGVVGPDFSIYEGTDMTTPVPYVAIKGGIISLSRYFATYYAKYNIRVNTISLGGIFDQQPSSFVEKYSKKTPLGRMAKAQEAVGMIIFLSSEASSYVTGQNFLIDGGWTAW